jgi:protein CsiD
MMVPMSATIGLAPFSIEAHPVHARLRHIVLDPQRLAAFLAAVAHVDVQQLEYVPFMRFVLAGELDAAFGGLLRTVQSLVRERAGGGFTAGLGAVGGTPDDFVRFGTAFAHLLGPANFDAMSGSYYARFTVEHTDASDSYLRQAYRTMMLHTDGTYVAEATDYLLMMKMQERHAHGGETRLIHLDDWADLEAFTSDPIAGVPMPYQGAASKNVGAPVSHPTFFRTPDGWAISFIDQFARPQTIAQGRYLERMLASLEASPATAEVPLPVGDLIVLNNAFWMHGRAAFQPDLRLKRELMRVRGAFAPQ